MRLLFYPVLVLFLVGCGGGSSSAEDEEAPLESQNVQYESYDLPLRGIDNPKALAFSTNALTGGLHTHITFTLPVADRVVYAGEDVEKRLYDASGAEITPLILSEKGGWYPTYAADLEAGTYTMSLKNNVSGQRRMFAIYSRSLDIAYFRAPEGTEGTEIGLHAFYKIELESPATLNTIANYGYMAVYEDNGSLVTGKTSDLISHSLTPGTWVLEHTPLYATYSSALSVNIDYH